MFEILFSSSFISRYMVVTSHRETYSRNRVDLQSFNIKALCHLSREISGVQNMLMAVLKLIQKERLNAEGVR